ncbi:phage terminase small subunit [Clostridioides difficile]|nr:phage terminase small subunit [Clostridioides difficile]
MARAPNKKEKEARKLYLKGLKLVEIAKKLDIPDGTVRRWKKTYNWDSERSENNNERSAKRGGQPNNKNAIGSGAPLRNKNNFKHGIFEQIYFDTLTDKELELIKNKSNDKIYDLELEIDLLTIREHRHMSRIKEYTEKTDGISLESVNKRRLEIKGNVLKNGQVQEEMETRGVSTFEVIQKLEAELTKIQKEKAKNIERLQKLKMDKKRFELEIDNNNKDDSKTWVEAIQSIAMKRGVNNE